MIEFVEETQIRLVSSSDMSWRLFLFPSDLFLGSESMRVLLEDKIHKHSTVRRVRAYSQSVKVMLSDPNFWVCNQLAEEFIRHQISEIAELDNRLKQPAA